MGTSTGGDQSRSKAAGFECHHDDYSSDMTNWADPVDSFDIDDLIPMFSLPEWYYIIILFAVAMCVSYRC